MNQRIVLTDFQMARLKDVQLDIRACMESIGRKAAEADENDVDTVEITSGEAFAALNVMSFAQALWTMSSPYYQEMSVKGQINGSL